MQEVEEYEEFDEAELVDDEDEDPDFTPGRLRNHRNQQQRSVSAPPAAACLPACLAPTQTRWTSVVAALPLTPAVCGVPVGAPPVCAGLPGDAEDEETGEGEEAGSSEGEISDTNAPYAEAEAQPAGRSRRGEQLSSQPYTRGSSIREGHWHRLHRLQPAACSTCTRLPAGWMSLLSDGVCPACVTAQAVGAVGPPHASAALLGTSSCCSSTRQREGRQRDRDRPPSLYRLATPA